MKGQSSLRGSASPGVIVSAMLRNPDAKSVTQYISKRLIWRATWHNKPDGRNNRETLVVSFGEPNYMERAFIRSGKCYFDGMIQFKPWPKKKKK